MKQRVVVTGVGVVAPNGIGKEAFWQALNSGLSGVRSIRRFDASGIDARIAGEVTGLDPLEYFEAHELKKVDRSNLYAMAAATMALKDSALELETENRERIGSAIGNALGGVEYVDKEIDVMRAKGPRWGSPYLAIAFFSCGTNGLLSIRLGLKGVVLTLCNGNTSGTDALGAAYRTIQSGRADVMFAGATEAPLVPLFMESLSKDGYLSKCNASPESAVRSFQSDADGMVLGEGSSILILESLEHARARGAHIYSEIVGYASGNSVFDAMRPESATSSGLVQTMQRVMQEAHVGAKDVDVIHAQGLSMPEYDAMEVRCMNDVFNESGHSPLVTAVGSWIGNSLGGLGSFQAASTALMLERESIPAVANAAMPKSSTINLVRGTPRKLAARVILQNSYCFMGKSSTLAFQRMDV